MDKSCELIISPAYSFGKEIKAEFSVPISKIQTILIYVITLLHQGYRGKLSPVPLLIFKLNFIYIMLKPF